MNNVGVANHASHGREPVPERIGPYVIHDEIGSGGMASVHLGKLQSAYGFARIVAIKRMHSELARSANFVAMFFQEARLVGRIQHPNVVAALDCVAVDNTAMLVMEYVHGVSLNQLLRKPLIVPPSIAAAIVVGAALGLHAAHEAVDENGDSLGIVHRDVSPHNILVGVDGLARVLDFGIAKAAESVQHTRTGEVKGKICYMAPEQLLGEEIGREADVYSLGVVLWELVAGRRLFPNDGTALMMMRIANSQIDSPRGVNPKVSAEVEAVVMKALARSPAARYRTALDFGAAIEAAMAPVGQRALGEWTAAAAGEELTVRSQMRSKIELSTPGTMGLKIGESEATLHFGMPAPLARGARVVEGGTGWGTGASAISAVHHGSSRGRRAAATAAACVLAMAAGAWAFWPRGEGDDRHRAHGTGIAGAPASPVASGESAVQAAPLPSAAPPPSVAGPEARPLPPMGPVVARAAPPNPAATRVPARSGADGARARVPKVKVGPSSPLSLPTTPTAPPSDPDLGAIGGRE